MLRFVCEHCKESVRVKEAFAGRKGRCPNCGEIVTIPGQRLLNGDDNVSALAAALGDDEHDTEFSDTDTSAAPPPPPSAAEPVIDEFELVDIQAAADFETDCYPAITPKDPESVPIGAPLPPPEPLRAARMTWQNILLVLLALIVAAVIGAMIIWTHFH